MPIPRRTPLIALMRLEAKHVGYLSTQLMTVMRQIDADIAAMGPNFNPITRMQAEAQRKAMAAYWNATFETLEKNSAFAMEEAARQASAVVSQYENQLLKLVMDKGAMNALAASEANRAAAGLEAALQRIRGNSYKPLSKTIYDTKMLAEGWVDDTINRALAAGWSRQKLAAEIRKSFDPKVPGGVSYAANRTARTEINNAFHASSAERYMNSVIVEGVDWNLSSSHPEGDICDTLADESPYPKKEVPQKPHPNCYCFITPALPTDEEFLEKLFNGDYDGEGPWVSEAKENMPERMLGLPTDRSKYGKIIKNPESLDLRDQTIEMTDERIRDSAKRLGISEAELRRNVRKNLQDLVDKTKPSTMVKNGDLKSILDNGFKTTHETGTGISGGGLDYLDARLMAEEANWGPNNHPFYGFLDRPSQRKRDIMTGGTTMGELEQYGDVQVIFKDIIRDRSSVTMGDTLNEMGYVLASPMNKVDEYTLGKGFDNVARGGMDSVGYEYIELQIHGAITAADIAEIVFKTMPSNEIQSMLAKLGIPWRMR